MSDRTRNIIVIVVVVVVLSLLTLMANSARLSSERSAAASSDLTAILRRRSPVTDYTTAWFHHTDCRKDTEDRFLTDVATILTVDRTDTPAVQAALERITQDRDALAHVDERCPTPTAPTFDSNGNQTSGG